MNLTDMNESNHFDLVHSPLTGATLIEASAGTGKTYAITAIFLRFLLEQQLKVSQILVVTYTVAATEELRDRIRRQIRAAIAAMENGTTGDDFTGGLIRSLAHPKEGLCLLKAALRNFDEAPIFTIHSFCQQVLREHAFESLSLFDTELITDERPLVEEIVEDFWRRNFYAAVPEFIRYAREKKYGPETFLKITRNSISQPDIRIQPEIQPTELHSLELFRHSLGKVKAAWGAARPEVIGKLKDPGLNKTSFRNPDVLISLMDQWLSREGGLPFFPGWEKFTPVVLKQKTNKNQQTPGHPFFDLCGELWDSAQILQREMDHQLLYLKTEIFRVLRRELPLKKEEQNIQSYDDLLLRVRTALGKPGGEALSQALRQRYRAALIDEFQDTDPVQYAIFQTVFGKDSILFLIGDPKQAIYSFRSADLFSYLRASRQVQNRYSLTHNWRSEPRLVAAINHVFATPGQHGREPFVFAEIPFHAAFGVDDPDRPLFELSGDARAPFQLVYFDKGCLARANAAGNKDNFRRLIAGAVAGEISRLLSLARQGKATIGTMPLQPGDMAVLVRENREARLVQDALHELAIPCVLHGAGNIFDSPEALEMERLLAGVAEPRSEKALGTALVTDIMGVSGEALMSAKREERPWEAWVNRFQQYNDLWEEAGFIRMFRTFLRNEDVLPRLLGYRDGERRLTNLLHLSEILHNESSARKLGMEGLIKWLARQRDPAATRQEEHELRLESDANAVRLVTIHKSKGLEYPLVFCPFQWGSSRTRKEELPRYHDDQDDWRLNLVLADEDQQAVILAERESLAENIRLLYVALTRAKYRTYLYWGPFKDAGSSAVAYTLHPAPGGAATPSPLNSRNIVAETETHFSNLTEDQSRADLTAIVERSGGTIKLIPFPNMPGITYQRPPETAVPLPGRTFTGQIPRADRIASFSYFVAHKEKEEDIDNADRDQAPPPATSSTGIFAPPEPSPGFMSLPGLTDTSDPTSIFSFPAGTRAGIFIHDIFEALDFTDDRAIEAVVCKKLGDHGYEPHWQATLCMMIRKVLAAPLDPSVPGLQLSGVSPASCLRELGFYFPLQPVTPEKLGRLFAGKGIPDNYPRQMGRLNFMPAQGFMNGYMDLVFRFAERFYLIDWKSNLLGTSIEYYGQDALRLVMEEDYYLLQYHLYVLALDQYLRSRMGAVYDYERHFGGVFYLFLRGVDPARGSDCGIYRHRPTPETIATLARGLIEMK
ncbi:MAG TPA: exodeoxyribonuclease V subunit beta [Syntrophus sp. (in: bacteria)]|nr:exodeoxyribonuclease V subunit beta [Syntrophus sp. (in: bacteria)]